MARTYPHVQKFVDTTICYAKQVEAEDGIPYIVVMGQAALESGYGRKAPGYNYFGVKWRPNCKDERQLIETIEYLPGWYKENEICMKFPEVISMQKLPSGKWKCKVKDWFRKYSSPLESFKDYATVLKYTRYKAAFSAQSPEDFIREIHKAGYATAPNYSQTVINVMELLKRHIKPEMR